VVDCPVQHARDRYSRAESATLFACGNSRNFLVRVCRRERLCCVRLSRESAEPNRRRDFRFGSDGDPPQRRGVLIPARSCLLARDLALATCLSAPGCRRVRQLL